MRGQRVVFRASSFVLCPESWNGDVEMNNSRYRRVIVADGGLLGRIAAGRFFSNPNQGDSDD